MNLLDLNLPIPFHPSMEVMDSTKLKTFQSCPRRFFYKYALGWRSSTPNNHLYFGICVHKAMEHLILNGYRTQSVLDALELFNTEYRLRFSEATDEIFSPKTPGRFFDMLIRYITKEYSDDPQLFTVYKTEFGGTIHLSDSHIDKMSFKMDTILFNNETEKYFSLEHKTTASNYISDNLANDFILSIQIGTYTHVLNCLVPPENTSGIIINCLCFKKTKASDFILRRFPIQLSNLQMFQWLETTKWWIRQVYREFEHLSASTDKEDLLRAFPLNGTDCTSWGRTCLYMPLCLNWPNPLQHIQRMPTDLETFFWNPLEEDLRETLIF